VLDADPAAGVFAARHLPTPQQRARNDGRRIALARNRQGAHRPAAALSANDLVRGCGCPVG
jgi:hypothetical protein